MKAEALTRTLMNLYPKSYAVKPADCAHFPQTVPIPTLQATNLTCCSTNFCSFMLHIRIFSFFQLGTETKLKQIKENVEGKQKQN